MLMILVFSILEVSWDGGGGKTCSCIFCFVLSLKVLFKLVGFLIKLDVVDQPQIAKPQ